MNPTEESQLSEAVAIIGMACRFPGADNLDALWHLLTEGREAITFFSRDELSPAIPPSLSQHPDYVPAKGMITAADSFDAAFFGITPREAELMDPQHRVLMELVWHAFENAGYDPQTYPNPIGVFVGSGLNTYFIEHILPRQEAIQEFGFHQTQLLNAPDYLATRLSYKLDLKGPSISLYTGCSTSLVAVCQAFDSLTSYQCDMALAGGAFIRCPIRSGYLYQQGEMFSRDGHTRPFDAEADGTVFSDGAGVVVLKRLADACEDGDFIYAVIRGSAVNNDGSEKMSFAAPSVKGQAEVIAMAQANAGLHPATISYIEAHGTATPLGDPIELQALAHAFQSKTKASKFCAIGSIKGNIGHLDAAAGVAGLIKTALSLHHKQLPPSLNFRTPNPQIDFENTPFFVNINLSDWDPGEHKRRAGVSSFGVGGTNAHVILEEAPQAPPSSPSRPWDLLLLSAKTPQALENTTQVLADHLKQHPELEIADVGYTLKVGRRHFSHRRFVLCNDLDGAVTHLQSPNPPQRLTGVSDRKAADVAFMFSGQGSQYVDMALGLYNSEPIFKREIDHCCKILKSHLSMDLLQIMYPGEGRAEQLSDVIKQTYVAQSALFVLEYALAKLWMSWGVLPKALVGHSIGEYTAACLAGVFSLEDALLLVADRGRLMQKLPVGSMLAVCLSEKDLQPYLNKELSLASVNAPSLCVVAGKTSRIESLQARLAEKDVDCRRLHTSHAFHSHMVEPILPALEKRLQQVEMHPPTIPFVSNLTGTWVTADEVVRPAYWVQHLRHTVRFADCIGKLLEQPERMLIEVGPGNTLCMLANQHPAKSMGHIVAPSVRHPGDKTPDRAFLLRSIGRLWLSGLFIEWPAFYREQNRRRVPLPGYPFERKRYWVEPKSWPRELPRSNIESSCAEKASLAVEVPQTSSQTATDSQLMDTERAIAEIWTKLLGYRHIHADDNFFDLGGNSLTAVRLFSQIEKTFGKRLPLSILYSAPTLKQLAEFLDQGDVEPHWSPLVEIQAGGPKPPIFCVHAEGGNVLEYRDLARHLGREQPFYGLQAMGLDGSEIVAPSIEEMAQNYINAIRAVQPKGPYLIGGYCLGGLVAYEMSQQLSAEGEKIALLAMISCSTPDHIRSIPSKMNLFRKCLYTALERIELERDNLSSLGYRAKSRYMQERMYRLLALIRLRLEGMFDSLLERAGIENRWRSRAFILHRSVQLSDQAYMAYTPKPTTTRIVLFRVSHPTRMRKADPTLGWQVLAGGGLREFEVPGFHRNILREPNVRLLADKLKACLDQVRMHA